MGRKRLRGVLALAGLLVVGLWSSVHWAQSSWYKYGPPTRYQQSAVYDSASDTLIVFAGQHTNTSMDFNDLWWANHVVGAACQPPCNLQWTRPLPNAKSPPTARYGQTAVYDAANQRMIMFGGAQGVSQPAPCQNDSRVLTFAAGTGGSPAWVTLSPSGTLPAARYGHSAVYDAANNRMVVFGGNNCSTTYFNDIWVLTNANGLGGTPAWTQLAPTGTAPAVRTLSSAVYDAANNRLILFGGTNGQILADLWVLTNANGLGGTPAWTQLKPGGTAPSARDGHSAVYDAANNLMIVYGGSTTRAAAVSEVWILSNANGLGGTPSWTQAVSPGNAPLRSLHSAAYDPASNKMFVFGGRVPPSVSTNPSDDHLFVLNDANQPRSAWSGSL